jgi:acetyl-CoA C-acetyltransferase
MGCGNKVPAWTVMRNCASGMQAIDSAIANIQAGRGHLIMAGGTDALSHAPLLYNKAMVRWFAGMMQARSLGQKVALFRQAASAALLSPVIGSIMKGLTDPMVGLLMGQTAENLAWKLRHHARADGSSFQRAQPSARRRRPCRRTPTARSSRWS